MLSLCDIMPLSAQGVMIMLQDRLAEYEAGLKVKDKASYMKAARMCAEYFDARGIASPSVEDWTEFASYARYEYFKENGEMPNDRTVKVNYEGRAKLFMKWISHQPTTAPQPSRSYIPPQSMRVVIDGEKYEVLSMLAIMEHRALNELLNDGAGMYIEAHAEQAAIVQEAMRQARQA